MHSYTLHFTCQSTRIATWVLHCWGWKWERCCAGQFSHTFFSLERRVLKTPPTAPGFHLKQYMQNFYFQSGQISENKHHEVCTAWLYMYFLESYELLYDLFIFCIHLYLFILLGKCTSNIDLVCKCVGQTSTDFQMNSVLNIFTPGLPLQGIHGSFL